ncbi:acyl-CoA N-acyltransferase [Aspergillus pseudonomiae]|nr:acyl-CoA N-acyltransferase [Aspergillus pseudonomiae]
MPTRPTISIFPASPEDAPSLTRVHGDAFRDCILNDLMFGPPTEENLKGFADELVGLITGDITARFVKAVDNDTNKIVGWSWWNLYPDRESRSGGSQALSEELGAPPESAISPEAHKEYFQGAAARQEKWIGGRPFAYLRVLVVLPEYQRKGIGANLIARGLEEATTCNLPVWLESSEVGYDLYKKLGFKDLNDSIVIDLAKYGASGISTTACMWLETGNH